MVGDHNDICFSKSVALNLGDATREGRQEFPRGVRAREKKTEIPLIIFVIRLKRPWSDNEKFGNNVAIS